MLVVCGASPAQLPPSLPAAVCGRAPPGLSPRLLLFSAVMSRSPGGGIVSRSLPRCPSRVPVASTHPCTPPRANPPPGVEHLLFSTCFSALVVQHLLFAGAVCARPAVPSAAVGGCRHVQAARVCSPAHLGRAACRASRCCLGCSCCLGCRLLAVADHRLWTVNAWHLPDHPYGPLSLLLTETRGLLCVPANQPCVCCVGGFDSTARTAHV